MKKQIKKLSLNKKTISNLQPQEMSKIVGGSTGCYPHYPGWYTKNYCNYPTVKGQTCNGGCN
jgi:natural product precursor